MFFFFFFFFFFPTSNLLSFSLEEIVTSYGEVPLLRNAALTMRANSNETQSSSCLSLRKKIKQFMKPALWPDNRVLQTLKDVLRRLSNPTNASLSSCLSCNQHCPGGLILSWIVRMQKTGGGRGGIFAILLPFGCCIQILPGRRNLFRFDDLVRRKIHHLLMLLIDQK